MRVLHIHSGNLYGGVETLLVTLFRHRDLCPQMESHFALSFKGRLSDELSAAGAAVHDLGNVRARQPLTVWRARRALQDLLRREQFDLAVCHSAWSQAIFGKVVRRARLPLVFWLHDAISGQHWLERWAARTLPDLALCNSRFTATLLPRIYPHARHKVLYCPVTFAAAADSTGVRAALRKDLETPESAIVIIQVGRMEPLKGHASHLKALALLSDVPGWVCWQVGGAQRPQEIGYLNELKKLATELKIADRIQFLEERSDVPQLLAAADIYCQPNTEPEAFGLTLVEALATGLPVVTTDIGGAKEILDESCGIFAARNDALAISEALRKLIKDNSLRAQLGAAGPARAHELCDPATRIVQLRETLEKVVPFERTKIPSAALSNLAN
jgi:glycosyltransferase involved in cell wall biosynthesis